MEGEAHRERGNGDGRIKMGKVTWHSPRLSVFYVNLFIAEAKSRGKVLRRRHPFLT
jgi:hypothetical protein